MKRTFDFYAILKLIKINFTVIRLLFFWGDVDITKVFVSNKNSFGEKKNYKCFIGYFCGNQKVKSLHVMLPKTTAYVKSYDGQTNWMTY